MSSSIRDMMKMFDKPGDPVLPLSPTGKPVSKSPKAKQPKAEVDPDNVNLKLVDKIKMFDTGMVRSQADTAASSMTHQVNSDGAVRKAAAILSAKEPPPAKNSFTEFKLQKEKEKETAAVSPKQANTAPSVFSITGYIPTSPKSASKPGSPDASAAAKRTKPSSPMTSPPKLAVEKKAEQQPPKVADAPVVEASKPQQPVPSEASETKEHVSSEAAKPQEPVSSESPKETPDVTKAAPASAPAPAPAPKAVPAPAPAPAPAPKAAPASAPAPAPKAAPATAPAPAPKAAPATAPAPAPKAAPATAPAPAPKAAPASAPAPAPKAAPAPAVVPAAEATEQAKQANAGNSLDHSATLDKPDFPKPPLFTDNK